MATSTLSFSLRLVTSADDLRDACGVRSMAYGHHLAHLQKPFAEPETLDRSPGTAIFLCRDKTSGEAIATARIQRSAFGPLLLENSLILPRWLAGQPRAEITRLSVLAGADPLAKLVLMKAAYLYCLASQTRWMVIGARNEALIRNYRRLGFVDVLGPDDVVPLAHAGGLAHRILAFDVTAAERTWHGAGHPLYAFMIDTFHADLHLFQADTPAPVRVVRAATAPAALPAPARMQPPMLGSWPLPGDSLPAVALRAAA